MRHRFAAIVLSLAACGFVAPVRAADPASDLNKYVPDGTGLYVHINVRQFLAAPIVRKAIPMATKKFEEQIMTGAQLAMMFAPKNAGPMPSEDQMKSVLKALQDPKVIATGLDAAKDAVTDIIVAGKPDSDDQVVLIVKCHEMVTADMVKTFAPFLKDNPAVKLKMHGDGEKTVFEFLAQNQPQPFFALPDKGVIVGGPQKQLVEKALAGGGSGLKGGLKKMVAERKDSDFIFVAMSSPSPEKNGPVSAWGRLVLTSDISAEASATFGDDEQAKKHVEEANEHLSKLADTLKGAIGPAGKDLAAALSKAKATSTGSTVTAKITLPGEAIEKLLAKD